MLSVSPALPRPGRRPGGTRERPHPAGTPPAVPVHPGPGPVPGGARGRTRHRRPARPARSRARRRSAAPRSRGHRSRVGRDRPGRPRAGRPGGAPARLGATGGRVGRRSAAVLVRLVMAALLVWPAVAVAGFLAAAGLVVVLGRSSTARYEFERNAASRPQPPAAPAPAALDVRDAAPARVDVPVPAGPAGSPEAPQGAVATATPARTAVGL